MATVCVNGINVWASTFTVNYVHICPPMISHWRYLANTIELVLSSAHPSPQPKRQIDRFNRFCTAYGRKFLYVTMGDISCKWVSSFLTAHQQISAKIAPSNRVSGPSSNTWFPGPIRAHILNDISIGSAVLHRWRRVFRCFTMRRLFPAQNCLLQWGDLDPI